MCHRLQRLAALVVLGLLAGCGYSATETFPDQYATVAVPIFENRSDYRDVETHLTEALIKEIQQRTPYKVTSEAAAQTILQGAVVSVDHTPLSRTRDGGVPQEIELVISVDYEWKDQRTGEILVDRRGFETVGRFIPVAPLGEPYEVAIRDAMDQLARDMVSTLQGTW